MEVFATIILNNIVPIFFIIFIGYLMGCRFELDIFSLTKLNLYIFMPALVLVKVYETDIDLDLLNAVVFGILLVALMSAVTSLLSRIRGYDQSKSSAVRNSVMFYNAGNMGIPLIALVFKDSPYLDYALSIQIMVLLVQNLTTNTIGLYNAGRGKMDVRQSLMAVVKMPAIYAITLAFLLKAVPWDMTRSFIWPAFTFIQNGLVPIALLSLGVQLSRAKIDFCNNDVYIATFLRLLGGPLAAYIIIQLLGIDGTMAQALFISSSVPTAVNTALIAVEFDNHPDFSSQVVITTSLLSAFTLTGIIFLSHLIF